MRFYSPLRYPGGKNRAIALFKDIIHLNNLQKCTYVEPFAGGASIALGLLIEGDVERIIINDADPSIYSFWISCLTKNEEFCELLINTKVTVDVWQQQKEIYQSLREDAIQGKEYDKMALGFATFFLNRTNRSGIIKGGVIGGHAQTGNYKIDARFNKQNLEERLKTIAKFADQVEVHCKDAKQFLLDNCNIWPTNTLIYCDPPYVQKGHGLYMNYFNKKDHIMLSKTILSLKNKHWVVTYDMDPLIAEIYKGYLNKKLILTYSVSHERLVSQSDEYIFFSNGLKIPKSNKLAKLEQIIL